MTQINPSAKAAQDDARRTNGQFGTQVRADNDGVDLGSRRAEHERIVDAMGWDAAEFVDDRDFMEAETRVSQIYAAFEAFVDHATSEYESVQGRNLSFEISDDVQGGYGDVTLALIGTINGEEVAVRHQHGIDGLTTDRSAVGRDQAIATIAWFDNACTDLFRRAEKVGMD